MIGGAVSKIENFSGFYVNGINRPAGICFLALRDPQRTVAMLRNLVLAKMQQNIREELTFCPKASNS